MEYSHSQEERIDHADIANVPNVAAPTVKPNYYFAILEQLARKPIGISTHAIKFLNTLVWDRCVGIFCKRNPYSITLSLSDLEAEIMSSVTGIQFQLNFDTVNHVNIVGRLQACALHEVQHAIYGLHESKHSGKSVSFQCGLTIDVEAARHVLMSMGYDGAMVGAVYV